MKEYVYQGTNKVFLPDFGEVFPGQIIKTKKIIRNSLFLEKKEKKITNKSIKEN